MYSAVELCILQNIADFNGAAERAGTDDSELGWSCAICHDALAISEGFDHDLATSVIPCGHRFHEYCLLQWLSPIRLGTSEETPPRPVDHDDDYLSGSDSETEFFVGDSDSQTERWSSNIRQATSLVRHMPRRRGQMALRSDALQQAEEAVLQCIEALNQSQDQILEGIDVILTRLRNTSYPTGDATPEAVGREPSEQEATEKQAPEQQTSEHGATNEEAPGQEAPGQAPSRHDAPQQEALEQQAPRQEARPRHHHRNLMNRTPTRFGRSIRPSRGCPLCRHPAFDRSTCHTDSVQMLRLRRRLTDLILAILGHTRSPHQEPHRKAILEFLDRRYADAVLLDGSDAEPLLSDCPRIFDEARDQLCRKSEVCLRDRGYSGFVCEEIKQYVRAIDHFELKDKHISYFFDPNPEYDALSMKITLSDTDRRLLKEDPKAFFDEFDIVVTARDDPITALSSADRVGEELARMKISGEL